jgi:hypothetical protein
MGWTGRFIVAAAAMAISTAEAASPPAVELIAVEHTRCANCLRFDATVGRSYKLSPQARIAPMRRVDLARGVPPDLADVSAVPTFILRSKGHVIGRIIGYHDPVTFYRNVDMLIAAIH